MDVFIIDSKYTNLLLLMYLILKLAIPTTDAMLCSSSNNLLRHSFSEDGWKRLHYDRIFDSFLILG